EASVILGDPMQTAGIPITRQVDTLTGYYKYSTTGADNDMLAIYLTTSTGLPIGTPIFHQLTTASNYTYFEVPFSGPIAPERFMMEIMSSDYNGIAVDGSTLIIDNLRFKNTPVSIDITSDN